MSEAKERAKERDDYQCRFCEMSNEEHLQRFDQGLHAHHIVKDRDGGPDKPSNYITVCRHCHSIIERTQADGLSRLKKLIIDDIEDEVKNEPDPRQSETGPKVKPKYSYLHIEHGRVNVKDFMTEVVGANSDGLVEQVVVCYEALDADYETLLREPIELFQEKVTDEAEYAANLNSGSG